MSYIIGADEVGYGSWAGPLVVCAVRAPIDWQMSGLNDSKQLTIAKRELLSTLLLADKEIEYAIVEKPNQSIDTDGLGVCLKQAYVTVVSNLLLPGDEAIIDGTVKLPELGPQVSCLVKADTKIPAVMAASIIAKVYRDNLMKNLDGQHPEYNWKKNVGYGTAEHKEAIKKYGFTGFHRKSYNIKL